MAEYLVTLLKLNLLKGTYQKPECQTTAMRDIRQMKRNRGGCDSKRVDMTSDRLMLQHTG